MSRKAMTMTSTPPYPDGGKSPVQCGTVPGCDRAIVNVPFGTDVLVIYGEEYARTAHPRGLTVTVARTVSHLSFLTAVHTATACSFTFPPVTNSARTWSA